MKRNSIKHFRIMRFANKPLSLMMCAVLLMGAFLPLLMGADSEDEGIAEPVPHPVVSEPQPPASSSSESSNTSSGSSSGSGSSPSGDSGSSGSGGGGDSGPGSSSSSSGDDPKTSTPVSSGDSDSSGSDDSEGDGTATGGSNTDTSASDGDSGTSGNDSGGTGGHVAKSGDDCDNDFGLTGAISKLSAFTNELLGDGLFDFEIMMGDIGLTSVPDDPNVTWPGIFTASYGDTLADLSFPNNGYGGNYPGEIEGVFTWEAPLTTPVGNGGMNTFSVIFTPDNTSLWNPVKGSVDILVGPITVELEHLIIDFTEVEYNGNEQRVEARFKPPYTNPGGSITVEYYPSTELPIDAGVYTFEIKVSTGDNFAARDFWMSNGQEIAKRKITLVANNISVPIDTPLYDIDLDFYVDNLAVGEDRAKALSTFPTLDITDYYQYEPGDYEITISGGDATDNYEIVGHIPGVLTVEVPDTKFTDPPEPGLIVDFENDLFFFIEGRFSDLNSILTLAGKEIHLEFDEVTGKYMLHGWPGYEDYIGELERGSVLITLYLDFINTLEDGTYILQLFFGHGATPYATPWTSFIIDRSKPGIPEEPKKPDEPDEPDNPDDTDDEDGKKTAALSSRAGGTRPPQSGDDSNSGVWIFVLVLSVWGILTVLMCRKVYMK